MKKIFLNESERLKLISEKEKAIIESFAKTFNKIKRIDENEIWDEDTLNRDTYFDTSYEDNWDNNQYSEEQEYYDAEIVNKEYPLSNGRKKVTPTLIDEFGEEYVNFLVSNTKQELEKKLKKHIYGQIEGFFNLNNGQVAVAFPSQSSKGEDYGGM